MDDRTLIKITLVMSVLALLVSGFAVKELKASEGEDILSLTPPSNARSNCLEMCPTCGTRDEACCKQTPSCFWGHISGSICIKS